MERLRRYRETREARDNAAEVRLFPSDFILPLFITEGKRIKEDIPGFENVYRYSGDSVLYEIESALEKGIDRFLLFCIAPEGRKDEHASYAVSGDNCVAAAIAGIKLRFSRITIIADVCLCPYTSHGHCGLVRDGMVLNDETLPVLAAEAVFLARAGADVLAPSAMMDGQVRALRKALDAGGLEDRKILAYSAKFSSCLYGPFRSALDSAPSFGDRKTYQCDYRSASIALAEIDADIAEGADSVMVKPAIPYLDIVRSARNTHPAIPLAAYHVSGEYMMIKAAAAIGAVDESLAFLEAFYAIRRAGADSVITYYAKEIAALLAERGAVI